MPTKERRYLPGEKVVHIDTGQIFTIEHDYGPKFHPPYTVKENGRLYFHKELQPCNEGDAPGGMEKTP